MTLKQVLTLLGTGLSIGGSFMPLGTVGGYSTNFFMGGSGGGLVIVILAGIAVIAAMAGFYKVLWPAGIGAFGYVLYSFFTFKKMMLKLAADPSINIGVDAASLTKANVQYDLSAWIMLFLGTAAILVAAIVYLPEDDDEDEAEA